MLISHNLHLVRILRYTWKVDLVMIITCAATYFVRQYIVPTALPIPGILATLLGTAIAFFIGFNNNQAYDRWWEARIIWGGLVNDSRTWARSILEYPVKGDMESGELTATKKRMIHRQIAFIYALKENLRGTGEQYYKKYIDAGDLQNISGQTNLSNAMLTLHARDLQNLSYAQAIDGFMFMQLNQVVTAFTDHMGKCERIKNTAFPTNYVYFTRLFIWALVVFTTLIFTETIGGWSVLIGWIVGFIFHVAHQNGMSLMEPFDEIPFGVPLNQMARTIEINLLQMLGEKDIPQPIVAVNEEYIM